MKGMRTMAKCEICGKAPSFGHNVSHSHVKTKRQWKPNIQRATIRDGNRTRRVKICAKCLKALHKA